MTRDMFEGRHFDHIPSRILQALDKICTRGRPARGGPADGPGVYQDGAGIIRCAESHSLIFDKDPSPYEAYHEGFSSGYRYALEDVIEAINNAGAGPGYCRDEELTGGDNRVPRIINLEILRMCVNTLEYHLRVTNDPIGAKAVIADISWEIECLDTFTRKYLGQ